MKTKTFKVIKGKNFEDIKSDIAVVIDGLKAKSKMSFTIENNEHQYYDLIIAYEFEDDLSLFKEEYLNPYTNSLSFF